MEELNAIYERMRTIFSEEAGFVPNDGCDAMVRLYALASEGQALLAGGLGAQSKLSADGGGAVSGLSCRNAGADAPSGGKGDGRAALFSTFGGGDGL